MVKEIKWWNNVDMKVSLRCHRCDCEVMRVYQYEKDEEKIAEIFCSKCGMLIVFAIGEHRNNFEVHRV